MFAVLKAKSSDVVDQRTYCCHLSDERKPADDFVSDRKNLSSNGVYKVVEISNLNDLAKHIMPQSSAPKSEPEDVLADVLNKLDGLGLNAENVERFTQQVQEQGEKAVAEVRSLGIRGMQVVGDGFVALGDLLKKAADKDK